MADNVPSQFPATAIDSFTTLTDNTDTVIANHPNSRASSIVAVQTKVGKNGDSNINSHDYLLTHLPAQAANWDAGSYEVRAQTFESDVATGTAPLTIASTTVCTNLNADTVDGKHVAGTNGAGEITTNDGTQTLTSKTLTSPDINGGTWNGTIDGNWTAASQTCANLGTVTTCDVNGGSIDGVTIGAAAAPTVTNLGSVATCDINGGTVNGISSLSCSAGASITEFSTDGTLGDNSDAASPTEKAVKTYVDTSVISFTSVSLSADASKSITGLTAGAKYEFIVEATQNTSAGYFYLQFNTDTGNNYEWAGIDASSAGTGFWGNQGVDRITIESDSSVCSSGVDKMFHFIITPKTGDSTIVLVNGTLNNRDSGGRHRGGSFSGKYDGASNVTSIQLKTSAGTMTGTIYYKKLL